MLDLDRRLAIAPRGKKVVRPLAPDGAIVRGAAEQPHTSEGSVRVVYHRALRRLTARAGYDNTDRSRGRP
jgi:RNA polymerase sigma-70 factor (ECF subfamily)